jgi:hypothetical protein
MRDYHNMVYATQQNGALMQREQYAALCWGLHNSSSKDHNRYCFGYPHRLGIIAQLSETRLAG